MLLDLLSMARGLGAITAGGHVAPATAPVLRVVEEHALAALIRAAPNARQFAEDERIGRGLDDRDDESGEGIANGNE